METGCWSVFANKRPLIDSGHGSDQTIDRSNDISSVSSGTSSVDSKINYILLNLLLDYIVLCFYITTDINQSPTGRGRSIRGRQHLQQVSPVSYPSPQFPLKPMPTNKQQNPLQSMKDATPYIPPEPTDDETEMFRQGISSGIHFEEYDKIPINVYDLYFL